MYLSIQHVVVWGNNTKRNRCGPRGTTAGFASYCSMVAATTENRPTKVVMPEATGMPIFQSDGAAMTHTTANPTPKARIATRLTNRTRTRSTTSWAVASPTPRASMRTPMRIASREPPRCTVLPSARTAPVVTM
ncbi:MAG: hypothetical protein UU06_C0003G0021 [Parcubacteria group bacterium GW2011_GWB1_40_5]|nr:MAG: hypothetical protein UU06_C0003G0021 [Parcubacteria group bacterium GW2011_GWB1_40_5]KKR81401.1 MAG: hypothetical protein UU27_C0014G0018 [Parcubacteria group bacterium GW2011_GWD1_40_9]